MKDLVIDDNKYNREIMQEYLLSIGIESDQADEGEKALEMVSKYPYQIIWLDLKMPVMNGFDFAEEYRKAGHTGKIIATTGFVDQENLEKCKKCGINALVRKPYNLKTIEKIRKKMKEEIE